MSLFTEAAVGAVLTVDAARRHMMTTMSFPSWFEQPATPPYEPLASSLLNTSTTFDTLTCSTELTTTCAPASLPTPVKSPIAMSLGRRGRIKVLILGPDLGKQERAMLSNGGFDGGW